MTTIYRAGSDSRNFSFEAFGASEDEARAALAAGLKAHYKQYRLHMDEAPGETPWHEMMLSECQVDARYLGTCYRDGEPLTTR